MARVILDLKETERDALFVLAEREFREPRAQAALILRAELERLGLLAREPLPANGAPIVGIENTTARGEVTQHAKN